MGDKPKMTIVNENTNNWNLKSDMCSVVIPQDKYYMPKDLDCTQRIIGLTFQKNANGLKLNVSGKVFATPTDLGLITAENYLQIPEKIYNLTVTKLMKNMLLMKRSYVVLMLQKTILLKNIHNTIYQN